MIKKIIHALLNKDTQKAFCLSILLLSLSTAYSIVSKEEASVTTTSITNAAGDVGLVLIGLSLLLGPLGKFFNIFDRFIHYRKPLGVQGSMYWLLYTVLYVTQNGSLVDQSAWYGNIVALILFALCIVISRPSIIRRLGANLWRRTLRYLSYTGFILSLYFYYTVRFEIWNLLITFFGTIPFGVFVVIFCIIVLAVRFITFGYDVFKPKKS